MTKVERTKKKLKEDIKFIKGLKKTDIVGYLLFTPALREAERKLKELRSK